ncbi:N-myc-interactor isoform X1 [Alosa sapidissima]|uniref:N-myc-interactor isoform X1 n=1 Tax=Alosa sapidissima TaxID=34773 RepID=UPI001C08FE4C|nr:N-myc-interactor isoform X1 [Alosa sapidissima]XP_041922517.1 N-myc-interactor isoform X1 [Alosa sapidissima]
MSTSQDDTAMNAQQLLSEDEQILKRAQADLEQWKMKVEKADQEKSRLTLEKLDTDETKKKAQNSTSVIMQAQAQLAMDSDNKIKEIEIQLQKIDQENRDLRNKLQKLDEERKAKKADTDNLQRRFKIRAKIPEKRVKFSGVEIEQDSLSSPDTEGVFTITQRPFTLLSGGEALITFEEEKVAQQILRLAKCSVALDQTKMDIKPLCLNLEPSVKFEVHLNVSKKTVQVSQAPPFLPEERMRDRLEISFSRPSRGGGEVERVSYDKRSGTAEITFLNTGVAERLALRGKYPVDTGREMIVDVAPLYNYRLKKFQTYCGTPKRSILLSGIQDSMEEEDLQDHLEIHFQKPSNYGGEIESIKYVSTGNEVKAFFSEDVGVEA